MGLFKSKTKIDDIKSIRSCTIIPFRDFMGWGFKIKPDGTRGFIADGKVEIEFIKKNNRRTVVTVQNP